MVAACDTGPARAASARLELPEGVVRAFGLDGARAGERLESYGNENWLVVDGAGARYVLRRHILNRDPRRIAFQAALQEHLAAGGFPTAPPLPTTSGDLFATDEDGAPWVLFRYVAGEEYDFTRTEQAVEAGGMLACFHLLAAPFAGEPPVPEAKAPLGALWADAERDVAELDALLAGRGVDDELAELAASWRRVLIEWPPARLDALRSGWLHGDFHGRNMAFQDGRVVGVFDLDDVDRGPYAHDVAVAMVKFGRERRGSLRLRPDVMRAFVDGYERVRPLTAEERAALPALGAMGHPPSAREYGYWREAGREDIAGRFRRAIVTMRAVGAQLLRHGPDPAR